LTSFVKVRLQYYIIKRDEIINGRDNISRDFFSAADYFISDDYDLNSTYRDQSVDDFFRRNDYFPSEAIIINTFP